MVREVIFAEISKEKKSLNTFQQKLTLQQTPNETFPFSPPTDKPTDRQTNRQTDRHRYLWIVGWPNWLVGSVAGGNRWPEPSSKLTEWPLTLLRHASEDRILLEKISFGFRQVDTTLKIN
jgi:hypothetical protein